MFPETGHTCPVTAILSFSNLRRSHKRRVRHAPAIAEHLDGGVDRAPRPRLTLRPYCLHSTSARYYGPDKRLQITSGRCHRC
jgi:hypothetical protein